MKKIAFLLMILHFTFACTSPETETNNPITSVNPNSRLMVNSRIKNYASNSLVIKYANWVNDNQKQFLRNYFQVSNYQLCSKCSNTTIELWMFDDTIAIEPKKETINNPPGGFGYPTNPNDRVKAIAYAEFNYDIEVASQKTTTNWIPPTGSSSYTNYIKNTNNGLTIAVFDTGVTPSLGNAAFFPDKFLYNASLDGISGVYSGWDFVNNDDNAFDDDSDLHGSAVTSIITRHLNANHIPYQILPIKVCDATGKGNYFNLICALNFALERKASILQMSLGWYNTYENLSNNIFTNLITQYNSNVTLVCSAGNDSTNNDVQTHLPSGYPISNIIAVASSNAAGTNISSWSNYGASNVDFFAKGEGIDFLINSIQGTSFATPMVTSKVAYFKNSSTAITNANLINMLNTTGTAIPGTFDSTKPVHYNKIIIP